MKKYVSIDIETTGLDPSKHQILEIGAIIEDWVTPINKLPRMHCYLCNDDIRGSAYALSMHPKILRRIATKASGYNYFHPEEVTGVFSRWLEGNGFPYDEPITVAGKNFASFDRNFLNRLPRWESGIKIAHRCIDPGNLYWSPLDNENIPSTKICMDRAGIQGDVAHTALDDAAVVIELIRNYYNRDEK